MVGFHAGARSFLFKKASTSVPQFTRTPTQWVLGTLSLILKQPESETDHAPSSPVTIKNVWNGSSTLKYGFMASTGLHLLVGLCPVVGHRRFYWQSATGKRTEHEEYASLKFAQGQKIQYSL
jgi:hypothetical protein